MRKNPEKISNYSNIAGCKVNIKIHRGSMRWLSGHLMLKPDELSLNLKPGTHTAEGPTPIPTSRFLTSTYAS